MAAKDINSCTPEEALLYIQHYFATIDTLNAALSKFETLERNATTIADRSNFRARALEAQRDIELLKNKRIAFLAGNAAISPPTQSMVEEAAALSEEMAKVRATEKQAQNIIGILGKALDAFSQLNPTSAAPA